ncbi:nitrogen permease regulator 2, partial [Ceraceosorus guamensis]
MTVNNQNAGPSTRAESVERRGSTHGEEEESDFSADSSSYLSGSPEPTPAIIDEQFLPRLVSVAFCIFHASEGPKVVYQVPEGSLVAHAAAPGPPGTRARKVTDITPPPLVDWNTIADFIIPKEPLCGRLVTTSATFKVLSHPTLITDEAKYSRNTFLFNIAFLFDGTADVRAYEPVVRKCVRQLKTLEQTNSFLSSPMSQTRMYGIIEQLYEDLNSYCETFIALPDAPHSHAINLKLFPTYANPPPVYEWQVPLALIDLARYADANWDLTMAKIFPFIDGINHVKRISQLADADIDLAISCMEHLLYYGCIIMIDIFQFFNMYTTRPLIATMATDESIIAECPLYVMLPGRPLQSWPRLLSLYSALKPGVTLHEWIEENDVDDLGIDVRRFVSFGIIKGFLRRVHRYPVLLSPSMIRRSTSSTSSVPPDLPSLLDATRSEDELCVRYGIPWSELHTLLMRVG